MVMQGRFWFKLAIAVIVVAAVAAASFVGIRLTKSLLGSTAKGQVLQISDVPYFGQALSQLQCDAPVNYHIYRQWGRHVVFISAKTSLNAITNFVAAHDLEYHPHGEMDTDLKHMAFVQHVDTQRIPIVFNEDDAYAKSERFTFAKFFYIRFRYSDERFTILFFN